MPDRNLSKLFCAATLVFTCLMNALQAQVDSINTDMKFVFNTAQSFENYTVDDGLPANRVFDILQDREGYIWIATESGLSRFNGVEFKNYFHVPGDSNSLSSNYITRMAEDSEGNLWVGTKKGLNRFNRKDETFTRFLKNNYKANGLPGDHIRAILADTSGILWLETLNGFFCRFDTKNKSFENYGHEPSFAGYPCHGILKLRNGKILISGKNFYPKFFDPVNKVLTTVSSEDACQNTTPRAFDGAAYEDENGILWGAHAGRSLLLTDASFKNCKIFRNLRSIWEIQDDDSGILWMGGWRTGAMAIDRKTETITVYRADAENPNSIVHNQINKIFIDVSGNVWFATRKGVSKLIKNQAILHIKNPKGSNDITSIIAENDTILWIGTYNDGLYRYDRITGKFTGNWKRPFLVGDNVESLHFDKNGMLWLGMWAGRGFHSFNTNTEELNTYRMCTDISSDWYSSILETRSGELYFGSWGQGPKKFDHEKKDLSPYHFISAKQRDRPTRKFDFVSNKIYNFDAGIIYDPGSGEIELIRSRQNEKSKCSSTFNVYEERKTFRQSWSRKNIVYNVEWIGDQLWYATTNGLFVSDTSDFHGVLSPFSPPNDTIVDIQYNSNEDQFYMVSRSHLYMVDTFQNNMLQKIKLPKMLGDYRESNLRVGQSGVYVFDKEKLLKYNLKENHWNVFSTSSGAIKDIAVAEESVWLVTKDSLKLLSKNSLKEQNIQLNHPYAELLNNLNSIALQSENEAWIGTDKGLFYVNIQTNEIRPFFHDPRDSTSLLHDKVLCVKIDHKNQLWVGTQFGLGKYLPENQSFECHNQPNKRGMSGHTICMLEDHEGFLWFGTSQGNLFRFDEEKEFFENYYNIPWDKSSLRPDEMYNTVYTIFEDRKKRLWVGGGKLSLYDETSNGFTHFPDDTLSLFSRVKSIQEDENGSLWLGTDRGLYLFDPEKKSFRFFGLENNIQGLEFGRASCKLPSGKLVFAGSNGFNIINFSEDENFLKPVIKILNFSAGEFTIDYLQQKQIKELDYNQNNIQFDIAVMDFTKGNKFKYFLEGADKSWNIKSVSNRGVRYTNLDPGNYTLKVAATNNIGEWSEEIDILQFKIKMPFWRNWLFRIGLVGFISFLMFRIIKWQQARLTLAKEKDLRLKFLQVKSLQSQMNPHFVFNVLGSMQNLILNSEPAEANKNLVKLATLIRRFLDSAVGIEMPNQATHYSEITLAEEEELLKMYIEFEQLQYKGRFDYEMVIDNQINKENFKLPPMLIQPYVENSIKHGLLYLDKSVKGLLKVHFTMPEEDVLEVIIQDNGVGRKKAAEIQKTTFRRYKSQGRKLVQRRVEVMNQLGYNIDINTSDPEQGGTLVKIKIDRHYDD